MTWEKVGHPPAVCQWCVVAGAAMAAEAGRTAAVGRGVAKPPTSIFLQNRDSFERWARGMRRAAVLICFLAIIAVCAGVLRATAQDLRNGPLITVTIGGDELRIPRNYFLPGRPSGPRPDAVLLNALFPSMAPMREDNMDEFTKVRSFGRRTISILIHDARNTTSLGFRLNVSKKTGAPYIQTDSIFGLERYEPKDFGVVNPGQSRPEIYVHTDKGILVGFMRCDVDGSVPFPRCDHQLTHRNLLLNINFGKFALSKWGEIERSVKNLLDGFLERA
jgi:hypothetical protein